VTYRGLRAAVSFLTPFGGARAPSGGALAWFPVVGLGIGAALGAIWIGAERAWPPLVAAAVVVLADLGATGALHFDGLVDAADGLLAHLDRPRRLAVMAEPGVGAFGLAAGAAALLARFAALATITPSVLLLAGLWCASRSVMALVALTLPYARPGEGLATAFLDGSGRRLPVAALGLAGSVGLTVAWRPVPGIAALAAAVGASAGAVALGWRRLGGYTGDVLGAAGLVGETVGLLVAAARW
jgi:adenosylcobinamide-GDP ribazoletransferase